MAPSVSLSLVLFFLTKQMYVIKHGKVGGGTGVNTKLVLLFLNADIEFVFFFFDEISNNPN